MSGLVIFFPVVRGGSTVRVRGEFVIFGSFLVRLTWHNFSYPSTRFRLESFHFPNCSIMSTRAEQASAWLTLRKPDKCPYFPIIRLHVHFTGRFNRLSTILPGSSFIFREMPSVTPGA